MTVAEFEAGEAVDFDGPLLALWWAGKGDWTKAHEVAQEIETAGGSWVHAYLHRAEGDAFNAAYWYRRAGKPVGSGDLKAEWTAMVEDLLEGRGLG
jgi:hypothetical protein